MKNPFNRTASFGLVSANMLVTIAPAQVVKFRPAVGEALEVWRVTRDPAVRDTANYHNTQCGSPDGAISRSLAAANEKEYGTDTVAEIAG